MRFPARALALLVLLAPALHPGAVHATSYAPVSFQELVLKADAIFVGDALDVRPFTVASERGTLIKTRVTFLVRDALFGTASSMESFEFLGGEVDGKGMRVAEMPVFARGDRRVVFARREAGINPIVGFTQGLMRVSRDAAGIDEVLTSEGQPIARTQDIGRPGAARLRRERPMPLSTLRAPIVDALRERRR